MEQIRLGRTGLMVSRSGFGAIPIQRIGFAEAEYLLKKAYEAGINFFDTARGYSDSEEKIGRALSRVRDKIIIATKSPAANRQGLLKDLETSLRNLKTDYIDVYQLHNPKEIPNPDDPEGIYAGLLEARQKGLVRFIGITNHRLPLARQAAASGLYDTMQFPLSSLSTSADLELVADCRQHDVGFIAMKGLAGGLITKAASTFAFLRQYDNVVPIWGIERESELDEFIALERNPPALDETLRQQIEKDRADLAGSFCRGCGYCLPCPAEIPIPTAARLSFLMKRSRYQRYLESDWQENMKRIESCLECGACASRCPYELDTPKLLKEQLRLYREFQAAK